MNLKALKIELDLDGTIEEIDISKELGNLIYKNTNDIGELELARKIYLSEGDIQLTSEEKNVVREHAKMFKAFVQAAILKELEA